MTKAKRVIERLKIMNLGARQVARIVNACIHPIFLYACEFTKWTKKQLDEVSSIGKRLVKHESVAMKRYPSELLYVGPEWGSIGLENFSEAVTIRTALFVKAMMRGKRDEDARILWYDSLEYIKQQYTFQLENVFQSDHRINCVKHSFMKWCAVKLHKRGIIITDDSHSRCEGCNLSNYLTTRQLRLLSRAGLYQKQQLLQDGEVRSFEALKTEIGRGFGLKTYQELILTVKAMPECMSKDLHSSKGFIQIIRCNGQYARGRDDLKEMLFRERKATIDQYPEWWLQTAAMEHKNQFEFLKNPFVIDRQLEWFHAQIRSGTLHTRSVCNDLYDDDKPDQCPRCGTESETIIHCLIRCKCATDARRKLVLEVFNKLLRLPLHRGSTVNLWFDKVVFRNGVLFPRSRKTSREYLSGMMGIESEALDEVIDALVKNGMKLELAHRKARSFVSWVKSRCIVTLHKLYQQSKDYKQQ